MNKHQTDLNNYLQTFNIVIGSSDAKFKKHTEKEPTWPDHGDVLTISCEKGTPSSVRITREKYANLSSLTNEEKNNFTFEFDVSSSEAKIKEISEHLTFIEISNLKPPTNQPKPVDNETSSSYKLEVVVRCDCGFNLRTQKHHTTFFFYQDGIYENHKHAQQSDTGSSNNSGGGGGWSSPPK